MWHTDAAAITLNILPLSALSFYFSTCRQSINNCNAVFLGLIPWSENKYSIQSYMSIPQLSKTHVHPHGMPLTSGMASRYKRCQTRHILFAFSWKHFATSTWPLTPGGRVSVRFSAPEECRSQYVQEGPSEWREKSVHEWRTVQVAGPRRFEHSQP